MLVFSFSLSFLDIQFFFFFFDEDNVARHLGETRRDSAAAPGYLPRFFVVCGPAIIFSIFIIAKPPNEPIFKGPDDQSRRPGCLGGLLGWPDGQRESHVDHLHLPLWSTWRDLLRPKCHPTVKASPLFFPFFSPSIS